MSGPQPGDIYVFTRRERLNSGKDNVFLEQGDILLCLENDAIDTPGWYLFMMKDIMLVFSEDEVRDWMQKVPDSPT